MQRGWRGSDPGLGGGEQVLQTPGSMQQLLADGEVLGSVVLTVLRAPRCSRKHGGRGHVAGEWSEHAKALAALTDGQLQHPVNLFIRVIRGEAQLVETGRARGEAMNSRARNTGQGWLSLPLQRVPWAAWDLPRVCSRERAVGGSGNNLERGTEGGKTSGWQLRGARGEL